LLADRAQRLKDELRAAAEFCIAEFRANALTPSASNRRPFLTELTPFPTQAS
jgi:hypothetical protein